MAQSASTEDGPTSHLAVAGRIQRRMDSSSPHVNPLGPLSPHPIVRTLRVQYIPLIVSHRTRGAEAPLLPYEMVSVDAF